MDEFGTSHDLAGFSGTVPLFPLPDTVHFPGVLLPLHVFEERYRSMTADALDGDRLIAMALLAPGWEPLYETAVAPIHDVVCIGRIVAEQRLPDGRYHFVLRGEARARVVGETGQGDGPTAGYRVGHVELLTDEGPPSDPYVDVRLRKQLLEAFRTHSNTGLEDVFHEGLDDRITLSQLCDVLAFAARIPTRAKQDLLAELDVVARARRLLELVDDGTGSNDREFPPPFSLN